MRYLLEYAEPYIVKTELTKNRTHQTYRWKQGMLSDNKDVLINIADYSTKLTLTGHRVVDRETGKVIYKTN